MVEDAAGALSLHDHQHDAVGDHVVQLARDPLALLASGGAGALAAFAVERLAARRRPSASGSSTRW